MNWKFSQKFRTQWIKVKFYKEKPDFLQETDPTLAERNPVRLKNVRFCEATKEAIIRPIILDRESISCPGARFCFGWKSDYKNELIDSCLEKQPIQNKAIESMLLRVPSFKEPFDYIGLNTNGDPDLLMSYMPPEEIMQLLKIYNFHKGEDLKVSLCSMMPICSGIAVKTYLEGNISLSFGCDDSRKYADMRRENLVVGIPSKLFKLFLG